MLICGGSAQALARQKKKGAAGKAAATSKTPATAKTTRAGKSASRGKTADAAQNSGAVKSAAPQSASKTITVRTEPRAVVWLDELRRGAADASGQLVVKNLPAGRHTLRVRATGFGERTLALLPAQRGAIEVKLTRTTDEAEILFQQAEDAREGVAAPADGERRKDAAELYRRALELRPRFPAARVGLARLLLAREQLNEAFEQIEEARRARPSYAEASAVEGRIHRANINPQAAIESYRRALREARGRQPEALTGLGIVYSERGDYEDAVTAFRQAIAQLQDTEPALYQLLGAAYEKLERYTDALAAYEKYLEIAPDGSLAPAVRSIVEQLRAQVSGQTTTPN